MDTIIHTFERAGLGKPPYKFLGISEGKSGCQLCGMGIKYLCHIESSDGKHFIVGSECVYKTDDRGLINLTKNKINDMKTKIRHDKEYEKVKELFSLIENQDNISKWKLLPHPRNFINRETNIPMTMYDYITWMANNCGNSGRISLLKYIKTL